MQKKATISWNARQISKMISKGTIVFDSAAQRSLVWDNYRKSLLIHSMIEDYIILPMLANRIDGVYSITDGKQRLNCVNDFVNDRFALSDLPDVTLDDGTEIDINGKTFSELPEEVQDAINTFMFTMYYYDNMLEDLNNEVFFRINNGKPLSNIELSRVRSKQLKLIREIGNHELFTTALTEKAFEKYTHEDLVIKSYIMLTSDTPCLDAKVVRQTMEKAEFTDQDVNIMNGVFNRILNTYKTIIADDSPETGKISKRIAKRLLTRTHMLSIMPIVKKSLIDRVPDDVFTLWVKNFFCGSRSATKYDEYNSRCTAGSGHVETIKVRLDVIKKDYNKFMKKIEKENSIDNVEEKEVVNDNVENVEVNEIVNEVETTDNTEKINVVENVETAEAADETEVTKSDSNSDEVSEMDTDVENDSNVDNAEDDITINDVDYDELAMSELIDELMCDTTDDDGYNVA